MCRELVGILYVWGQVGCPAEIELGRVSERRWESRGGGKVRSPEVSSFAVIWVGGAMCVLLCTEPPSTPGVVAPVGSSSIIWEIGLQLHAFKQESASGGADRSHWKCLNPYYQVSP